MGSSCTKPKATPPGEERASHIHHHHHHHHRHLHAASTESPQNRSGPAFTSDTNLIPVQPTNAENTATQGATPHVDSLMAGISDTKPTEMPKHIDDIDTRTRCDGSDVLQLIKGDGNRSILEEGVGAESVATPSRSRQRVVVVPSPQDQRKVVVLIPPTEDGSRDIRVDNPLAVTPNMNRNASTMLPNPAALMMEMEPSLGTRRPTNHPNEMSSTLEIASHGVVTQPVVIRKDDKVGGIVSSGGDDHHGGGGAVQFVGNSSFASMQKTESSTSPCSGGPLGGNPSFLALAPFQSASAVAAVHRVSSASMSVLPQPNSSLRAADVQPSLAAFREVGSALPSDGVQARPSFAAHQSLPTEDSGTEMVRIAPARTFGDSEQLQSDCRSDWSDIGTPQRAPPVDLRMPRFQHTHSSVSLDGVHVGAPPSRGRHFMTRGDQQPGRGDGEGLETDFLT